ncbi:MAG: purine-nucleoside phosphorylase [Bacteroidetes bacterium]|nr:purine-nucleoside phosphorylase [Bacteroidota bacterium]
MLERVKKTVEFINTKIDQQPKIGIILGTGLGGLVEEIEIEHNLPYEEIPEFPVSTVKGHAGSLIFGKLAGVNVVAMQGRFHYYEGYEMEEVTFPVRVMKMIGVETLLVSNASGGVNPSFDVGDIMIITDHINLMPNALIGKNYEEFGPRFPDMSEAYNKAIIKEATKIARNNNIKIQKGVYAAVTGPTFETPAEYKYIRTLGADTVGMSTVPEVIVARHMDMTCFAVSVISDLGVEGSIVEISHDEVIEAAKNAEPKMTLIIKELLATL